MTAAPETQRGAPTLLLLSGAVPACRVWMLPAHALHSVLGPPGQARRSGGVGRVFPSCHLERAVTRGDSQRPFCLFVLILCVEQKVSDPLR